MLKARLRAVRAPLVIAVIVLPLVSLGIALYALSSLNGAKRTLEAQINLTAELRDAAQDLQARLDAAQEVLAAQETELATYGNADTTTARTLAGLESLASDLGDRVLDLESADASPFDERVRAALLNDPGMLFAAVDAFEQTQNADLFATYAPDIQNDPFLPAFGNPNGDVTLVEYFDYNCGFCRGAMNDVLNLVEADGNIRLIFKEFPILSQESHDAAMVAMAAAQHVSYLDLHRAAMRSPGQVTGDAMLALAVELGASADAIRDTLVQQQAQMIANLDRTRAVSQAMGITGTPAFFIEDRMVPGAVSGAELAQVVAEIRAERQGS